MDVGIGNPRGGNGRSRSVFLGFAVVVTAVIGVSWVSALIGVGIGQRWDHAPVGSEVYATGRSGSVLRVLTWNVAAINNNPFEYWVGSGGDVYEELMRGVAQVVEQPKEHQDVLVSEVFTEEMAGDLFLCMQQAGWKRLKAVKKYYTATVANRTIISGFLKDAVIGRKRLVSMFDRVTNTIVAADGSTHYRPSVVNCYGGSMGKMRRWWQDWLTFVFKEKLDLPPPSSSATRAAAPRYVREMLKPITQAKYPAVTAEEEVMSVPLQVLHGAIFDVILAYTLNSLDREWEAVRRGMCVALNAGKTARTVDILADTYGASDAMFLQEVSEGAIAEIARNVELSKSFTVVRPEGFDAERNQNSVLLLRRGVWGEPSELTTEVLAKMGTSSGVSRGDLLAVSAVHKPSQTPFLLASFHGDTNGLLTIPVVDAVHAVAGNRKVLFGLDANAHTDDTATHLGVTKFADFFVSKGLTSCWGMFLV